MGEEQKKQVEEKQEEAPKAEKEKLIDHENKKAEETMDSSNKESKEPPPPPPQEIVLQVYMHCEGCARKVRRCLKGFEGVEDVQTDCKTHKVVVKGDKADPLKVLERVQRKSHRQAVLLSPIPKPPAEEPKKPEDEKDVVKAEEKKEEPQVIIVVLGVHMHCEACAQEIKKRIQRMKGVESAEPDLKSSQVTVKGVFEPSNLVEFIYKRTGKQAKIVKVEPEKKEEKKPKEGNEEKNAEGGGGGGGGEGEAKKGEQDGGKEKKEGGGGGDGGEQQPPPKEEAEQQEDPKVELRKNEFYYYHPHNYQLYPQRLVQQELYAYPPQIFSDENPNACSVM